MSAEVGSQIQRFVENAGRAQEAVNRLGAGPPGTGPLGTCFYCGKNLHRARGYYELTRQPGDETRSFCSVECLHWQLHEDEKL